jgi:hypothetical protein
MEISVKFPVGDDSHQKLERARACAQELSSIECSWHSQSPTVSVDLDDQGELKWALQEVCCDEFGRELALGTRRPNVVGPVKSGNSCFTFRTRSTDAHYENEVLCR